MGVFSYSVGNGAWLEVVGTVVGDENLVIRYRDVGRSRNCVQNAL